MKVNEWGWNSTGVLASLAVAVVLLAVFTVHCLRAGNPLVEPALFRLRAFTGATLALVPFSTAFGAMLLALVLWEEGAWNWSPLQAGLAIAPGPFLVPVTALLVAGRLIKRFGTAPVVTLGLTVFAAGCAWWAIGVTVTPNLVAAMGGIILTGIGVGLTMPTLMGAAAGSLPPSSFATGSAVVNMIRQTGMAVGVAGLIAIIGTPAGSVADHLGAFRNAWWAMTFVTLLGLVPTFLMLRARTAAALPRRPPPGREAGALRPCQLEFFPSSRAKRSVVEGPVHPGRRCMNRSLHCASRSLPRGHPRGSAPIGTTGVCTHRISESSLEKFAPKSVAEGTASSSTQPGDDGLAAPRHARHRLRGRPWLDAQFGLAECPPP